MWFSMPRRGRAAAAAFLSLALAGCLDPRNWSEKQRFVIQAEFNGQPAENFCVEFSSFYGDWGYLSGVFVGYDGRTEITLAEFPLPLSANVAFPTAPLDAHSNGCVTGSEAAPGGHLSLASTIEELNALKNENGEIVLFVSYTPPENAIMRVLSDATLSMSAGK